VFRQASCLRKIGIPFDLAWLMADCRGMQAEVIAYIVVDGELEGGHFDLDKMEWEKPGDA
jgi:hypothetical protein